MSYADELQNSVKNINYADELRNSVKNIIKGNLIDEQIKQLLMESDVIEGWWPPPGTNHGSPLSESFWAKVMVTLLQHKHRGESPASAMYAAAKEHKITTAILHTFLDKTGLLSAFRGCRLDPTTVAKVFNGAARGSGIWTSGTETDIVGQDHFHKSVNPHSDEKLTVYTPPKSMHHPQKPKKLRSPNPRPKSSRISKRLKRGWWANRHGN